MPRVSVILPTYHHANTIRKAIESIRQQTYNDWELIIVDDASNDGTQAILDDYRHDPRIKIFRNEVNSKCPACVCNKAVRDHATGDYLAFQFDDDFWLEWCLDTLIDGISDADFAYGQSIYIDFSTKKFIQLLGEATIDKTNIITGNKLANNAILIKREVFNQLGGFDENPLLRRVCDWELWIRILYKGYKINHISKVISVCFLFNPGSVSMLYEYDVPAALQYIHDKLGVNFLR